jgi:hypothetical protein
MTSMSVRSESIKQALQALTARASYPQALTSLSRTGVEAFGILKSWQASYGSSLAYKRE